MHIINITVRDKIAVNPAQGRYVCGNSDFVVHFDFDAEWDAYETKTARFVKEDGTYREQIFTGTECPVPVISDTYKLQVGVFAGNLSTTTGAYVPCKKSILCGSGSPALPEDNSYHVLMGAVNEASKSAKAAEETLQEAFGEGGLFIVTCTPNPDRTQEEIREAAANGKTCLLVKGGRVFTYYGERTNEKNPATTCPTFFTPCEYVSGKGLYFEFVQINEDGYVRLCSYKPAKTPNPQKLHIKGAVEAEYDGSKDVNIELLPKPADTASTAYLRWNGTGYVPATVEAVKAEMGGQDAGVYELIEEITLEDDDVGTVTRDKTPGGESYHFKAIGVNFEAPPATQQTYVQFRAVADGKWLNLYIGNGLRTTTSFWNAYIQPEYGYLSAKATGSVVNKYDVANSYNPAAYDQYFKVKAKPITSINLITKDIFPAGTIIKIWGVRANA